MDDLLGYVEFRSVVILNKNLVRFSPWSGGKADTKHSENRCNSVDVRNSSDE